MRKPCLGFPTRSDTNRPEQSQNIARSWKLQIKEEEGYIPTMGKQRR